MVPKVVHELQVRHEIPGGPVFSVRVEAEMGQRRPELTDSGDIAIGEAVRRSEWWPVTYADAEAIFAQIERERARRRWAGFTGVWIGEPILWDLEPPEWSWEAEGALA